MKIESVCVIGGSGFLGRHVVQRLAAAGIRVRVPTQVIWGEADVALPITLLRGLDELVDDLTVCRLPNATHWLAHEEPGEVARLIRAFIAR